MPQLSRLPIRRARGYLGYALLAACAGAARADLAPSSPFLPAGASASAAAGPATPVELRGVMSAPEGTAYCIYEPARKRSTWVAVNEPGHDFTVRSADASGDGVEVDFQGRRLHLVLRAPKVSSSGAAVTVFVPVPTPQAASAAVAPPPPEDSTVQAARQQAIARRLQHQMDMKNVPSAPPREPGGR